MKQIKSVVGLLLLMWMACSALAQTNAPTFIKGNMDIQYNSKSGAPSTPGVKDMYTLSVNVCNSALFHGTIQDTPQIISGMFSKSVTQARRLDYDIACDVVNPKNPAQTKNVGKMSGMVPITSDGVYRYDNGTLSVDILPGGSAAGFSSRFNGQALGKPLGRPANWLDTLKRQTVNITRNVNGKPQTVKLTKYDKMEFRNHIVAAGPVQVYQEVTVNGEMLYDYDKTCWFFNNVTVQYSDGGIIHQDHVTGTIRWVPDAQRRSNGLGEYQFDVRVNEPLAAESAWVEAKVTDESAFFDTDTRLPALTGTMKYTDRVAADGDTTLASKVAIDLVGNNITKQQTMVLAKVVIFSCVVPMNAD